MLGIAERPDFVALDSLALEVAKRLILILAADLSYLRYKFQDSVKGNIANPRCGAKAVPFH